MDITQFLNGPQGKEIIENLSKKAGTTSEETAAVVNHAAPVLMGMLHQNASTQEGAQSLLGALNKHDGSILDSLGSFFNSGDTSDGEGILGHILGGNQNQVQSALSQKTGVSSGKIGTILAMLAPIIMGFIGKNKQSTSNSGGGITDILGGLLGGNSSSAGSDILGSILGGLKGGNSGGGLGSLLGGLFGGK